MKVESYKQGTPSWVDLSTTDQDAAKEFYSKIFGWEYQDNPMGDGQVYSMAQVDGSAASAIFTQMSEEADNNVPPHWNVYITVDDIEATAAKVPDLGGTVVAGPFDVFEAGRMIVAQDPSGAFISFWQAKQHVGAEVRDEHGAISWAEMMTTDQDAAGSFFTELLGVGLDKDSMPTPDDSQYYMLMTENGPVAGIMPLPPNLIEMGVPPCWTVYFAVDDVDSAIESTTSMGGERIMGPMPIPDVGRIAILRDPQGAVFGVQQPSA